MYKNTPRTYFMGGATPTDMTMINRGVFFMGGADSASQDWKGKPADWSDIRKDCPENSIALYAGVKSDYSQYDNLGFTANCVGGYNVFIDGTQYGTTYASGAQCSITWSTSGITTGDDITTPSALKAHKMWIMPATEGAEITEFKFAQVDTSDDNETQGALWVHFNITNAINLENMGSPYPYTYGNYLLTAVTAKNNVIDFGNNYIFATFNISALTYVPTIKNGSTSSIAFSGSGIQNVTLDSCSFGDNSNYCFNACHNLKDVKLKNPTFIQNGKFVYTFYQTMLKTFPANWDWTNIVEAQDIWTDYDRTNNNGTPTVIDTRAATMLKILGIHDTNTLVGLRVSNQAPFDSETSPQIDVHNTALDRAALVQLFNDLPTVTGGQIINITGCNGASSLIDSEVEIATNKGWTVTGGPAYQVYATYNASVGDTIKLNDGMATSDYTWSAYPSDTAITGDYTQTATVTAVDENNVIECAKPTQDNKDVTINSGEVYYAYTNENDSDDSVYTTDDPISKGAFILENATNNGCTDNQDGTFTGGSGKSLVLDSPVNFGAANSWEFQTSFKYNGGGSNSYGMAILGAYSGNGQCPTLMALTDGFRISMGNNGSTWNMYDVYQRTYTMETGVKYNVLFGFTGTQYYLKAKKATESNFTPVWDDNNSTKVYNNTTGRYQFMNYMNLTNSMYFNGPIYLNETSITIDGATTTFGYFTNTSILYDDTFTALNPQPEFTVGINSITVTSETPNITYNRNSDNDEIKQITSNIEVIDNTTIQTTTIISDQDATIETSANVTTDNNDIVISNGAYHLFNLTIPTGMTPIIESSGASYQANEMPLLLKNNSGVGFLLKDGNSSYYRNSWTITRDYDLHYQQINFSYPSGATVTCKVNNVAQSNLTPYVYANDIVTWTCDNAGTITSGTYTVPYSSLDGKINVITIS